MGLKKEIPNIITLGNLACGLGAIYCAFHSQLILGAILVLSGAFLDFFDGLAARLLKVAGPLGKELDSMADLVSFGVAPGFLVLHLFPAEDPLRFGALIIPLLSAYRLAKFNIDTRQSTIFLGLPTPANALMALGLVFGASGYTGYYGADIFQIITQPIGLLAIAFFGSIITISEIPLLSFKFGPDQKSTNKLRLGLIILTAVSLFIFSLSGLTIIVLLYLLFGVLNQIIWKHDLQS
ncbi:MAG: CDP-diacylglycerol--serine O-phosphatidyltransferase [Sphingobacteriales bacterium]